jgi:ABC-2 type transport system ATP-binding protein
VSRREFWKLLSEFLAQGITIVMATPYLDEAERCSRVGLLSNGKLLIVDTPQALRDSLPGLVLEVLAKPQRAAMEALRSLEGVADIQSFGERIHVRCVEGRAGASMDRVERLLAEQRIDLISIREVPASLEDVFINRVAVS